MNKELKASFITHVLIKNNINISFFLYCLKKDIRLIRYLFFNAFYFIISVFINKDLYEINRFRYLKSVKNLNPVIKEYVKNNITYLNYYEINADFLIAPFPEIIIKKLFKGKKVIAYKLNDNYKVDLKEYRNQLNDLNVDTLYINRIKNANYNCQNILVNKRLMKILDNKTVYMINKLKRLLIVFAMLVILSLFLTEFSFLYTHPVFELSYLNLYKEKVLLFMNFIPIFIIMLCLYFITSKLSISFLITSIAVFSLGVANQTKLVYRDDVVKFSDLTLIKEASIMLQRYNIVIKKYTIAFLSLIIIIFLYLRNMFKNSSIIWWKRIFVLIIVGVNIIVFKPRYFDSGLYERLGDTSTINKWIETRQSQIRGLMYPFIYSIQESEVAQPLNYSKQKAKSILNRYNYQDIDDNKKVNIMAIMLEAYNDFTRFNELDLDDEVYKDLHDIENESMYGNLVTTIYGGGTIVTERNFLTGYETLSNFRSPTNSFVWYFREQGYYTDGNHPIFGSFYNRRTVNNSLGFENYDFYEEKFSKYKGWGGYASDKEFFDEIINGYKNNKKSNKPYFSFSVTYQNHGPYISDDYEGKNYYFPNPGISHESYNIINEYFDGIKDTNEQLKELINFFDNEDEPVIIIFFGDHNPYLGNAYAELNIDMDVSTSNGYENYYDTLYVIHANNSAKQLLNKSFVGKSATISPMFILTELFDYLDIKGNEYMQYLMDLKSKINVINSYYYKENGEFINAYDNQLVNEYRWVNYYMLTNFINSKNK